MCLGFLLGNGDGMLKLIEENAEGSGQIPQLPRKKEKRDFPVSIVTPSDQLPYFTHHFKPASFISVCGSYFMIFLSSHRSQRSMVYHPRRRCW